MADQNRKNPLQEESSAGGGLSSNLFMEGLADFIQTSLSCDKRSSAVKDDQCSAYDDQICNSQEQIREPMAVENMDVVQQREVSSSKPSPSSLLNHNVVGPLLLQALDGFLLIISSDGVVEFVSDNIYHYLSYSVEDLMGKSIYRFLHPSSHQFFGSCLESLASKTPLDIINNRNFSHEAKFRINTADEFSKDLDESNFLRTRLQFFHQKSRRMSRDYDLSPSSPETENQSYLVCIAQRIGLSSSERNVNSALNLDQCQFTTKQDLQGKILNCDSSSLRAYLQNVSGFITIRDFVGKNVLEFCHPYDKDRLRQHHEEVVKNGTNMSGVYRFQILKGKYVFVQTKSKLFKNPTNNKPEFIMSTHSIVRMCDSDAELKGSAEKGLMQAIIGPTMPNHRESFWLSSLSGGGSSMPSSSPAAMMWKDSSVLPNSSSMLLPPPDMVDPEPGLQWSHSHLPFSRSYSATGPQFNSGSRPPSVASDRSPQHKNSSGIKRAYKRKRSSPSSDVRSKNVFYEGMHQEDLIVTNKLSKKPSSLSVSSFSLESMHRNKSGGWESAQSTGVLPPLQALQQLQVSFPDNSVLKPDASLYNSPTISQERNMLTVFSPSTESCNFFPLSRMPGNKGEGLRALLTATDEDELKNDYEMAPIKSLASTLIPGSNNSRERHKEIVSCFNRSPPQEPQSTTQLGENPNSPKELHNGKRGQSPGRCNLLMNLLTGATDDEDEDSMKVNESKTRTSMRILAKLETLQSLPDTSLRLQMQSEKSEVESTSENNTLLKALLKSNSEGDRPTKKADILSKLLSDSSDDVFIHPATEISSTVGNDSEGVKLFLTSSNQCQPVEMNISQKPLVFKDTISSMVNMENAGQTIGGNVKRNGSCTSTIPAITSSLMTAPQPNSPQTSLLSVASSSLSFLISCSNGTITSNSSLADGTGEYNKRSATNGNCKLLKELLSTQPAPQNIVNPCRISALPMASPQTMTLKKLHNLDQSLKIGAETTSLEANKVTTPLETGSQNLSKQLLLQEESQGNDLSGLLDDGDFDLESILSSMASSSFELPLSEDIEPLMMSQIEHAIMTADLSTIEIDQLINNSDFKESLKPKSDRFLHDRIAITEIQNELMKIGASRSENLAKANNSEMPSESQSNVVPAVIPQVKNQSMDVCVARTSLMTVAHKGAEEAMTTTCGGSIRRRSVDPPAQTSREIYGENSLQHFKDMMNVSIAPNVTAPRTSVPMTLGQLLNRSSKTSTDRKESNNQKTSKSSEAVSSQATPTQDSVDPRSPILLPAAPIISRRGASLSLGVVPGSLQALHQHHSLTQVNLNQNSHSHSSHSLPSSSSSSSSSSASSLSSIVSFKSVSENERGKTLATLCSNVSSSESLSISLANKNVVLGSKDLPVQRMHVRQHSIHIDGNKVIAHSSGVVLNDGMSSPSSSAYSSTAHSSTLPLQSLKPTGTTTSMNAKLALKGVLQGRSQNNQNNQLPNQVTASAKLSDALKLPKKSEDEPKLLIQQSQVYLKSFVDGRTEDSIEAGLSHSVMPYAFQSMSSDLDDLEVIIAQEEKESRHFESQVQAPNSAMLRQATPGKVGYITVGNGGQHMNSQPTAQPPFSNVDGDSAGSQFSKSQDGTHKIVFVGEQDKLFHVQMGNQVIKQQLVPQQAHQAHQLLIRQQPISQSNILFHQPISYQSSLPSLPQHLIFGQVCPQNIVRQPKQPMQQPQILPLHVSPLKVTSFASRQHALGQQDQHLHQQFGSNVSHFHHLQLQPQQLEGQNSKNQESLMFQAESQHQSSSRSSSQFFIQQNVKQHNIMQENIKQNLYDANCKQVMVDNFLQSQSHRTVAQQKCEQTTFDRPQSLNSTPPLFGVDGSDIGNLEDDEIYQLISALSNEESAFCLSQLSEEAMNWADSNANLAADRSKESLLEMNKVLTKNVNLHFTQPESKSRVFKNIPGQSVTRCSNLTSPMPMDADFLNKPALQDNMALDSLLFQSSGFSTNPAKLRRPDQEDPSSLNQPKRHAMLEKLLAE